MYDRAGRASDGAEDPVVREERGVQLARLHLHERIGAFLDRAAALLQLHNIIHGGLQL